jgi:hypothetical protein
MPYSAEISRANPTCFLFLVDQSGSMKEPFGGQSGKTKAQGVADAINRLVQTLVLRCAQGDYILDRYYIGVIGYGGEIGLGFSGALAGEVLRPVSQIGDNPLRVEQRTRKVEDGMGGLVNQPVDFSIWFEPVAAGKTRMCVALELARGIIEGFVKEHPHCFPPVTINITDGAATDGDPESWAAALGQVASSDGNSLLFNIHISGEDRTPVVFPASQNDLSDPFAQRLFRMSSVLPSMMLAQAQESGFTVGPGARGFAFNADLVSAISLLDIGTRVNPQRT